MRNHPDRDDQHANAHGFTIDDDGKVHDIKPPKRKRTDNARGVSLGGQDIDKEI